MGTHQPRYTLQGAATARDGRSRASTPGHVICDRSLRLAAGLDLTLSRLGLHLGFQRFGRFGLVTRILLDGFQR